MKDFILLTNIRLGNGKTYTLAQLEKAGLSYVPCLPDKPVVKYTDIRKHGKQVTYEDYLCANFYRQNICPSL